LRVWAANTLLLLLVLLLLVLLLPLLAPDLLITAW
jgi:hypothetical protein